MENNEVTYYDSQSLRSKAEEILKNTKPEDISLLTEADLLKLIHEFRLHQVELELQNQELRRVKISESEAVKLTHKLEVYKVELESQNEELRTANALAKDATDLYDFAPTGYFTLSREGEILRLNVSGADLLGNDRSKLEKSRLGFFVSDETKPVFNHFLERVFKNKTTESCEVTLFTGGNALIYAHLTGIFSTDNGYCHVTVTDITEHKQAEIEVQSISSRLELAMQVANMAWWEMDIATGSIRFEKRKAEMLGYLPENFKHYTDFTSLIHPDDLDKAMNAMRSHFSGEVNKYEVEYRIMNKAGEYKWFYDIGTVVKRDPKGMPLVVTGLVLNVTDRKLAENVIRETEARFRLAADNAPVLIWQSGTDALCNYFNQPWLSFTGRTFEQEIGNGWTKGVHPDDLQSCLDTYRNSFAKKTSFEMEYRLKRADGEYRWLLDHGIPRFAPDGEFLGYIGTCLDITESKLVKEALLSNTLFTESLLNAIPAPIFYKDSDGRYIGVNKSFEKFYGTTNEVFRGKTVLEIAPNDLAEIYSAQDNELLMHKGVHVYDSVIKDNFGALHDVVFHKATFLGSDGKVRGLIGMILDVTERKVVEKALKESESRFKSLFEHHSAIMLLIDPASGMIIDANAAAAEFYGYSKSVLQLMNINEINILTREQVKDQREKAKINKLNCFIFQHKLANGEDRTVEVHSSPIGIQEKQILFSIIHDITDRKKLENELATLAIRNQTLMQTSSDGIHILDTKGNVFEVNDAFCNMLGYTREEMLQLNVADWDIQWKGDDLIAKLNDRIIHPCIFETIHRRKNGTPVDVEINATGIVLDGCQYQYSATRDITERKLNELILKKYNEELLRANSEKDKFFSIIAHDLRGPIGGFMGLTEQMAEGMANMTLDELQKMARVMKKSSSNLYNLLGNLLEWSRMQRGLTTFEPVSFLLMQKIIEVLSLISDEAIKKEIRISHTIPGDLVVFADENMLASIIRNLVANAVKFTPQGGKIGISAEVVEGRFIKISITDSGIGMNTNILENLFNMDVNTSRKGTGGELSTGLGLMICKDFIEKHGGELTIESEVGTGSRFSFVIPAFAW